MPRREVRIVRDAPVPKPAIIAEVHVSLFGLEPGQAEVTVRTSPAGPLSAARGPGSSRSLAYAQLLEAVEREVRQALTILGGG